MEVNTSFLPFATGLYHRYTQLLECLQGVLLLLVRVTWGFLFMQAGWGKWQDISKVVSFFTELGIPLPELNAYVVSTTELVGGVFLLLGLLSRLTPIPLIIAMVVAYATTEQEALHELMMGNPDSFFAAAPFLFFFSSLLILLFGPGILSVDHLLAQFFPPAKSTDPSAGA